MKKLVLLMGLMLGLSVQAGAAECVSKEEMKDIASHFTQLSEYAKTEFCYDGSETSHLIATIMFMRKTEFQADMQKSSDDLFSGKFSTSWYKYFIGRINEFEIPGNCPKGVAAYVYSGFGRTMYACPAMLTDNFSALDRASIFMHEARHIDGFPHMTCTQGARKGLQGACDRRISDGGSYAVTVETYAQLAKYATDIHPALKAYAMASAVTYADETFETPARVDRQSELLLLDNSKNFSSLNLAKGGAVQALGQAPALGHIVLRAQHLILFPEDKALPAKYVFTKNEGELAQSAGDAATEYNNSTPAQKADFVDLHIAAQWSAKVFSDKVKFSCSARTAAVSELSLNSGNKAAGILYVNGYDRVSRMHYLATTDGSVYEFGCTDSEKAFLRVSTMKIDQKFKRVYKLDNMVVGLTFDGYLFQINGTTTTPISTSLDGRIYEIAPRQSYTFMDAAR